MDPRATQLAQVFIDHSLNIEPGHKLLLSASDFTPLELLQECYRLGLERGAIVELDVFGMRKSDFGGFMHHFMEYASETQLTTLPEITLKKIEWADKILGITVVHNDEAFADIDPARISTMNKARLPLMEKLMPKDWVITEYPTDNLAKRSEMTLQQFTDFYYNACLIDYSAQSKRLQQLSDVLDAGKIVHIEANGTDITLGIEGRLAAGTNTGRRNVPDGECFLAPLEDKTEGTVTFELPQRKGGMAVEGIELVFRGGKIEKASAKRNEKTLLEALDEHPDNRRLGELGIGMNTMITKYIGNILFDEKIAGTVHMALGRAYGEERGGGKNQGTIHWDLVKDLRMPGSKVSIDDRVIIKDGEVLI
jgi:aminopeptidase